MLMSALKDDKFSDRLSKQDSARAAMLARFRARPGPDDPAVIERRAAQAAIEAAREIRQAERKAAKEAEAIRLAEEKAAQAVEQQVRDLEAQARAAEEVARSLTLAAERKAARDAKYAARVARRK